MTPIDLYISGNRCGKSRRVSLAISVAMLERCLVNGATHSPFSDLTDEARRWLVLKPPVKEPKTPPSLRLTAHERRNPNQPFYRGIHQKRKNKR